MEFTRELFVRVPPNITSFTETIEAFLQPQGYGVERVCNTISIVRISRAFHGRETSAVASEPHANGIRCFVTWGMTISGPFFVLPLALKLNIQLKRDLKIPFKLRRYWKGQRSISASGVRFASAAGFPMSLETRKPTPYHHNTSLFIFPKRKVALTLSFALMLVLRKSGATRDLAMMI